MLKGISRVYSSMRAIAAQIEKSAYNAAGLQPDRYIRGRPRTRASLQTMASSSAAAQAAAQDVSRPATALTDSLEPTQPPLTVCVYGSLLKGLSNHHLLERSRYLGKCQTHAEFTMYDMSNMHIYPAVCARGKTAIHGELYEVDHGEIGDIDRLEGHPRRYERQLVTMAAPEGQQAWMYLLPRKRVEEFSRPIQSGDWRAHLNAQGVATRRSWAYVMPEPRRMHDAS